MILQIGAVLGQIGQQLLSTGLEIGTQFLNRELSRGTRRAEKDRIKAQARAAGASPSFTTPASPGALSPALIPPPSATGFLPGMLPQIMSRGALPTLERAVELAGAAAGLAGLRNGGNGSASSITNIPNGLPTGFSRFTTGFVLDSNTGCLRPTFPGEKSQFRQRADGSFVRKRPRRMNPLNFSAFKRAERRVNALERVCRSVFKEARKAKTGTIRRKTRRRKK